MVPFTKGPEDELDYAVEWERVLGTATIASSSWAIEAPEDDADELEAMVIPAPSYTASKATVRLAGGTLGNTYIVTNTIVSSTGEKHARSFKVIIQRR